MSENVESGTLTGEQLPSVSKEEEEQRLIRQNIGEENWKKIQDLNELASKKRKGKKPGPKKGWKKKKDVGGTREEKRSLEDKIKELGEELEYVGAVTADSAMGMFRRALQEKRIPTEKEMEVIGESSSFMVYKTLREFAEKDL